MSNFIQFGCGLSAPEGWHNFDVSPRLTLERLPLMGGLMRGAGVALFPPAVRKGNIVAGLPVPPQSADGVYCSHVLEHLARADVERALNNTFAMLKPGGVFRLVVPDLGWRAERFVTERAAGRVDAADRFMSAALLGQRHAPVGAVARLRQAFGNSAHLWMYDEAQLTALLEAAGFIAIRRAVLGDVADPHLAEAFAKVEAQDRFVDEGYAELALHAERPDHG
ncbi:MAG: methyltransferase domain-containing protein [Pseudomonadota bacterium]